MIFKSILAKLLTYDALPASSNISNEDIIMFYPGHKEVDSTASKAIFSLEATRQDVEGPPRASNRSLSLI
ncbi:hypothetical protein RRG08_029868 [Elysia crispata]|uniref:Uncharacterized protein n=1 Tax=Elysia crispata TaxID=231223 RepID=A0AAE0YJV8_9GAST|nr:hypothetical protein RRG08_029868 [Elysia crispata]